MHHQGGLRREVDGGEVHSTTFREDLLTAPEPGRAGHPGHPGVVFLTVLILALGLFSSIMATLPSRTLTSRLLRPVYAKPGLIYRKWPSLFGRNLEEPRIIKRSLYLVLLFAFVGLARAGRHLR